MLKNYFPLLFILFLFSQNIINGQTNGDLWTKTSVLEKKSLQKNEAASNPKEFQVYDLNLELLRSKLSKTSPIKGQKSRSGSLLTFPNANGILEKFNVFEASIMEEGLQRKYPDLRSYIGKSIDNPSTIIRFSFTPQGLHAIILNSGNTVYIDPYTADKKTYMVYLKKSLPEEAPIDCEVKELNSRLKNTQDKSQSTNDGFMRTFRLAVTATGEYSQYHLTNQGVSTNTSNEKKKEIVISSIIATMTRVNAVFERDLSITMVLIENNDKIIFLDPDTDNLTNTDKYTLLNENQPIVDETIGPDNYDIGHVFAAYSFGGVAYVNSFCKSIKSRAVSGSYRPKGAYFEGVIMHEMGHQYGANHTFNNCEDYWIVTSTSVEPSCGGGSGSIMSYSVNYNDLYFHLVSSREIWNNIKNSCGTTDQINNLAPELEILPNYNIPISTPFILNAIASDSNGDHLTYTFQQLDTEPAPFPIEATAIDGPAFRALPPDISSMRYFPDISTVIDGELSNTWEVLPEVERTMKFGITVRDNNINGGQTASIETNLFFKSDSGPFTVTSPSINTIWHPEALQTIEWDVANTNNAPVSCSLVNILLSTDGGYTFPIILASNVPNNGSYEITVPNVATNNAKIKVESVGNIFYALNSGYLTLDPFYAKTNVPDTNFEQALIDLGHDDLIDGVVLTSNISNLSELNVTDKNINDLTGIEEFKSLRYLICKNNQLTNIDVRQNIHLKSLKCHYNKLQHIDLSQNSELEYFNCRNNQIQVLNVDKNEKLKALNCLNNQITDLNLSQNIALTNLYANYNQITVLDLSKNKNLEILNCKKNQLVSLNIQNGANVLITDFDATANPSLQCIEVDDSDDANTGQAPYNNWSKDITVTYCKNDAKTYVPDDNFERLLICMGYDDVLDDYVLTSNINTIEELIFQAANSWIACPEFGPVIDLTGIEDFVSLRLLEIYNDHRIKIIDLTKNTALRKIYFQDAFDRVENFDLKNNTGLEVINLEHTKIYGTLDLSKNIALWEVNISDVPINEINLRNGNNTNLRNGSCHLYRLHPNLSCIQVDDPAYSRENWFQDTEVIFSKNCNYDLKTYIPDNNFEQALIDLGYDDILNGYVLTSNISNISVLNVSDQNINDLTGIEGFKNLSTLNCTYNRITNLDLRQNIQLQYLKCHYNQLQNIDVSKNLALETLNCRNNQIQDLKVNNNEKLKVLNCLSNQITNLNLSQNIALTTLYCNSNKIIDLNLSKNRNLEMLNCKKNQLVSLNIQNGANAIITDFDATGNPALLCIIVDTAEDANADLSPYDIWNKDITTIYCANDAKTYVPDDNFEKWLICSGYDDIMDNYVLTSNISSIEDIHFVEARAWSPCEEFGSIRDLTGIEDFTALNHLSIDEGHGIELIDLSKNTSLISISIYETFRGFENLDLTKNVALERLYFSSVPISGALDLSNCPNLKYVNIEYTQINKLNLKNGNNSGIASPTLDNNENLTCIQVDNTAMATTNWIFVDPWMSFSEDCSISEITYVPDNNFEQALIDLGYDDVLDDFVLTANISGITNLDVNGKNISTLTGIQDFKNLRSLNCNDNQLNSLDMSKNIELTNLKCYRNQLVGLDVSKNTALLTLSCNENQLTSLDLSQNPELTILRCNDNQLFALDLSNNPKLELLICRKNDLAFLNVKSGGNSVLTSFSAIQNPLLTCIEVDNSNDANAGVPPYNNWSIDSTVNYSKNCSSNTQGKTVLNIENDILSDSIVIYPNPVTSILNIDSGILPITKIEVYSILGQKIKEIKSDLNAVEMYDLTGGVYLIRLYSKTGMSVRRIIKSE